MNYVKRDSKNSGISHSCSTGTVASTKTGLFENFRFCVVKCVVFFLVSFVVIYGYMVRVYLFIIVNMFVYFFICCWRERTYSALLLLFVANIIGLLLCSGLSTTATSIISLMSSEQHKDDDKDDNHAKEKKILENLIRSLQAQHKYSDALYFVMLLLSVISDKRGRGGDKNAKNPGEPGDQLESIRSLFCNSELSLASLLLLMMSSSSSSQNGNKKTATAAAAAASVQQEKKNLMEDMNKFICHEFGANKVLLVVNN